MAIQLSRLLTHFDPTMISRDFDKDEFMAYFNLNMPTLESFQVIVIIVEFLNTIHTRAIDFASDSAISLILATAKEIYRAMLPQDLAKAYVPFGMIKPYLSLYASSTLFATLEDAAIILVDQQSKRKNSPIIAKATSLRSQLHEARKRIDWYKNHLLDPKNDVDEQ